VFAKSLTVGPAGCGVRDALLARMKDKRNCPSCGNQLEMHHQEINWCPRCAMVDELIEELIRRQIEDCSLPPKRSKGRAAGRG